MSTLVQKQFRLWTPIANSFEAYRRRIVAEPKAVYEHVWRLIHIHESLIVTLGIGLATRLLTLWTRTDPASAEANRLRREVTGLAVPGVAELDVDLAQGEPSCLEGFIKPWIDLLKDFAKDAAEIDCPFCKSLALYLMEKPAVPLAFSEPWKRVAEIPQVFVGELSRIDRFDAINTLRNKLAHVPVPHRILQDLHWGLRQELLSLLAADYKPQSDSPSRDYETKKWHEPLRGRIVCGSFVLVGSSFVQEDSQLPASSVYFEAQPLDDRPDDRWCVSPFVRVDEELKVSLLFLLNDIRTDPSSLEFRGEYHRFAAEIQPVQKETVPR